MNKQSSSDVLFIYNSKHKKTQHRTVHLLSTEVVIANMCLTLHVTGRSG